MHVNCKPLLKGCAGRVGTYSSGRNLEIAQRGTIDHSATVAMHSVRGSLQFYTSFPMKIDFASRGLPRNAWERIGNV